MYNHHPDVQGTQHGDIEDNVGKIFVDNDAGVHGDDEYLLAKLWDVLKNPAQVAELHDGSGA